MNKKLFWGFGICGLFIFALVLRLAWMNGQVRGLDYRVQVLTRENDDLKDEIFQLRNQLNDLIQIGKELKHMPLYNVPIKQTLGVADIIRSRAETYRGIGMTAGLILAVIRIESAGNKRATSYADCYGLMQLLPTTAAPSLERMGFNMAYGDDIKELLFIPTVNVLCGIHELVRLRTLHLSQGIDSWHITLMAYLYGPNGILGLTYSQNIIQQREEMRGRGVI